MSSVQSKLSVQIIQNAPTDWAKEQNNTLGVTFMFLSDFFYLEKVKLVKII